MKVKYLYKTLNALALSSVILFASCDKEEDWTDTAKEGGATGVSFGQTLLDGQPVFAAPDDGTITSPIAVYSSVGGSTTVTLAEDPSLVTEFNDANGTEYPAAPAGYFTLPTSVSISGNKGTADASFDVTRLYEDLGVFQYAVGLRITGASGSTSTVLADHSEMVVIITIQNQFEADYSTKGYFVHPSSPRSLVDVKHLATLGAVRCEAPHSDLYTSDYYFDFDVDGSNNLVNYAAAGATPPVPSSGFMTVDNPTGNATYPGGSYTSANYNNTYSPDAQTFFMHYGYGTGSTSQTGYSREVFETWVRQ